MPGFPGVFHVQSFLHFVIKHSSVTVQVSLILVPLAVFPGESLL